MKNKVFKYTVYIFTLFTILLLFTLIVFLYNQSLPFFLKNNFLKFIFGRVWDATEVSRSFGIFNILLASVFISILACIISLPIAIGTALYLCFYTKKSRVLLIWLINILAGIPSIIYGFFGMIIIVKNIENPLEISKILFDLFNGQLVNNENVRTLQAKKCVIEEVSEEIGVSIDGEEGKNEKVEIEFIRDKLKIFY